MTTEHTPTMLDRLSFPELYGIEPSIEKGKRMIGFWKRSLIGCVEELIEAGEIRSDHGVMIEAAINKWSKEDPEKPDHGAFHSYYVYEGQIYLAQQDGHKVDERVLQIQAIMHDLMQTVPASESVDQSTYKDEQRKIHAKLGSLVIRKFGAFFNCDRQTIHETALSIRHHDATQEGRDYKPRGYEAELLADADKLFGASLSRNPLQMTHDLILRNLIGGQTDYGWYLLRDLSKEEIAQWQYGDRWFSDARSAVWKAVMGTQFFTKAAQEFNHKRKDAFTKQAEVTYGNFFDQTAKAVQFWLQNPDTIEVFETGKSIEKRIVEDLPHKAILCAYTTPLIFSKSDRDGRIPYGRKLVLTSNQDSFVLDPSVARFCFSENGELRLELGKRRFLQELLTYFKE